MEELGCKTPIFLPFLVPGVWFQPHTLEPSNQRIIKLKINFTLKTGVSGEVPVLAVLNYGYKEYDVNKQKKVYKPLKYYTGIKCTKSDWDEVQKLPVRKAQQTELLQIEKHIKDVFHALTVNGEVTHANLKNALDQKIKGKEQETIKRIRIVDFGLNEILEDLSIKKGTRECYNTLRKQIGKAGSQNWKTRLHARVQRGYL